MKSCSILKYVIYDVDASIRLTLPTMLARYRRRSTAELPVRRPADPRTRRLYLPAAHVRGARDRGGHQRCRSVHGHLLRPAARGSHTARPMLYHRELCVSNNGVQVILHELNAIQCVYGVWCMVYGGAQ